MSSTAPVMPTSVGQRPTHPAAIAALIAGIALTGMYVSFVIASRLHFSSDLGRPLFWHIYDPTAWARWLFMAYGPTCYNYMKHTGCYVPAVYAALSDWLRLAAYGIAASIGAYAVVTAKFSSKKNERVSSIVDTAHFASIEEIHRKTTLLSARCGPILGKVETVPRKSAAFGLITLAPAKWEHLRGGLSQTGCNIVGISGVGKTPDYMKQLLLNPQVHPEAEKWSAIERRAHPHGYEPNLVIFDLKGSLFASTSHYQKHGLNKNVFVFSPYSRDYTLSKYNPLHFIRLTEDEEFDDCYTAGLDIVDEGQGLKDYWSKVALDFGAAIVATVGYTALAHNTPSGFSHAGVVDYVSSFKTPDLLIEDMLEREHDPHGAFGWDEVDKDGQKTGKKTKKREWIVRAITALQARATEEKSGIFGSFISYIGVYRGPILRQHISETTFDLKSLANDPKHASTVYIVMPDSDLERIRPFFRIMVKDMFRRLMTGTETLDGRELPGNIRLTRFVLDEVRALNRLEPLAMTAGFMRGHKVIVDTAWQTRNQLIECYGQNETISGNLGTDMFYQTKPGADAKYLSEQCGKTTYVLQHRNLSGKRMSPIKGQIGEQNNVQTRSNLTEYEASNMGPKQKIIFVDGAIIRAHQCRYYESKQLDQRASQPRITNVDVALKVAPFVEGIHKRVGDTVFATLTSPPPDRWRDDRELAEVLPSGCRVRRSQAKNAETGAWMYFGQVWLPHGIKPVLNTVFSTEDEREKAIDDTLGLQEENDPEDRLPVFLPHNEDPAVSFEMALSL